MISHVRIVDLGSPEKPMTVMNRPGFLPRKGDVIEFDGKGYDVISVAYSVLKSGDIVDPHVYVRKRGP